MIADREKSQEVEKRKLGEIIEKNKATGSRMSLSPSLTTPITLKLTKDLKTAYETIAKLGGINVIFDPDLGQRLQGPTPVELTNVTIIEALDLVSLQTKTYWTVVNKNTILVATTISRLASSMKNKLSKRSIPETRWQPPISPRQSPCFDCC
jgi:hypothetical protein